MMFNYRPYQSEDFLSLHAIEQQAFKSPQTEGQLNALLNSSSVCWVATGNEKVLGFAIARIILDEAELLNIAVHPDYHGSGVAKTLFLHLAEYFKAQNVNSVFLEVRASNTRAIGFYQRNGFDTHGARADYYVDKHGGREDAVLMRLQLNDLA